MTLWLTSPVLCEWDMPVLLEEDVDEELVVEDLRELYSRWSEYWWPCDWDDCTG